MANKEEYPSHDFEYGQNVDDGEDEEEEENEEEQQAEEQRRLEEAEKAKKKAEEKILKNKLRLILARIAKGSPVLKPEEKKTMQKAKKHEGLKNERNAVNALLLVNKAKLVAKAISSTPVLKYILIGALIIVVIICVVVIIASIMPFLFPDDETLGGTSSPFGVNGSDFYGVRTVYKDDDKAATTMIEDYVELVENGIEEAENISSVSSGGKTYNITLEVDIPMPAEDYDYTTFDEGSFQSEYATLHKTIFDIAKAVYKVDNSADFAGASLIECVNGILYFGYGETVMADVSGIITNAINAKYTYSSEDEGSESISKSDVDSLVSTKLTGFYEDDKYLKRAEKLFVKDYIFTSDDETMKDATKQNYVAFIFMPKTSVIFKKFSFSVGGANLSEFTIELTNNGNEISLNKDNSDFSMDKNSNAFIYMSGAFVSETAGTFTEIDTDNISALAGGMSLFDIVEQLPNYSIYLESKTSENSVEYYTIKKNGVVANLSNSEAFHFVEFETTWK